MKRGTFINIVAYFFIILFLYTGISKWMDFTLFREQIASSPLLASIAGIVAIGLPLAEIVVSVFLFIPAFRLQGLYASLILMVLFTGYVGALLSLDSQLPCSCGGVIELMSWKQHLIFNIACTGLSLAAVISARTERKRRTATIIVVTVLATSLFTGCGNRSARVSTGKEGQAIPSFNLSLVGNKGPLNTEQLPGGRPLIAFAFSPFCPFCRAQLSDILENIDRFKDINLVLVTPFARKDVQGFYDHFQLVKYPNIMVGTDSANTFLRYYNSNTVPYLAVYDTHKRLKEALSGRVPARSLVQLAVQ